MGLTKVDDVLVETIVKRKQPKKQYDYVMQVDWRDGVTVTIYRSYDRVLNLQRQLRKLRDHLERQKQGKQGSASALALFLRDSPLLDRSAVRTSRQAMKRIAPVEEFLKSLVQLPRDVSGLDVVIEFFRPVPEDMVPPDNDTLNDGMKEHRGSKPKNYPMHISEPILLEQYVAICDYEKVIENGLCLKAGNIVDVIQKNDHGWWFVDLDGKLGWVPASYLEPRDGSSDEYVMGFFEDGEEELYIVMTAFDPEFDDEVALQVGQVVKVKQKNLDGWWLVISEEDELGWVPAMNLREVCSTTSNGRQRERLTAFRSMMTDIEDSGQHNVAGRRATWDPPSRKQILAGRRSVVKRDANANLEGGPSSYVNLEFHQKSSSSALGIPRSRGQPKAPDPSTGPSYINMEFHEKNKNKGPVRQRVRKREEDGDLAVIDFDKLRSASKDSENSDTVDAKPRSLSNVVEEDQTSQTSSKQSYPKERSSTSASADSTSLPQPGVPDTSTTTIVIPSDASSVIEGAEEKEKEKEEKKEEVPKVNDDKEKKPELQVNQVEVDVQEPEEPQIYYALGDYKPEDDQEVELTGGTPVEVLEESEGGWWLVRTGSLSIGWAPSNYLDKNPAADSCKRRPRDRKKPPRRPPKSPVVRKKIMQVTAEQRFWKFVKKDSGGISFGQLDKESTALDVPVENLGPSSSKDDSDENDYDYPDAREIKFDNRKMLSKRKGPQVRAQEGSFPDAEGSPEVQVCLPQGSPDANVGLADEPKVTKDAENPTTDVNNTNEDKEQTTSL